MFHTYVLVFFVGFAVAAAFDVALAAVLDVTSLSYTCLYPLKQTDVQKVSKWCVVCFALVLPSLVSSSSSSSSMSMPMSLSLSFVFSCFSHFSLRDNFYQLHYYSHIYIFIFSFTRCFVIDQKLASSSSCLCLCLCLPRTRVSSSFSFVCVLSFSLSPSSFFPISHNQSWINHQRILSLLMMAGNM
jgi:hypothetical protein